MPTGYFVSLAGRPYRSEAITQGAFVKPSARHRDLTRIFIAVYPLAGSQRERVLDRLCTVDPELRREVEEL